MDIDTYSRKLHAYEQANLMYRAAGMMNTAMKLYDELQKIDEIYQKAKESAYSKKRELDEYVLQG
jgi:signal recognition particle GTPase